MIVIIDCVAMERIFAFFSVKFHLPFYHFCRGFNKVVNSDNELDTQDRPGLKPSVKNNVIALI